MRQGDRGFISKTLTSVLLTLVQNLGTNQGSKAFHPALLFSTIYDSYLLNPNGLLQLNQVNLNGFILKYENRLSEAGIIFNRKASITY